jgi:hypothetical protein
MTERVSCMWETHKVQDFYAFFHTPVKYIVINQYKVIDLYMKYTTEN